MAPELGTIVVRVMVPIEEIAEMSPMVLVVFSITWLAILALGFLLLGTLRALGVLTWRLDQLVATTPRRVGREGLSPGTKAPDFTLLNVAGQEVSMHDFAGRKILLVFTQSGCGPCQRIMPELNRLQTAGQIQVLVVNNGELEPTRTWAVESRALFPVAVQEHYGLSRRYEVFATPYAFLIDEQGVIASKGIINTRQHIGYILDGATADRDRHAERIASQAERGVSLEFRSSCVPT